MNRRSLLALFLATASLSKAQEANFYERLLKFHLAYDKFIRTLKGCPMEGFDEEKCVGGSFDYRQWNKLKKLAEEVFKL